MRPEPGTLRVGTRGSRLKSFDPASREGARRLDAVRELFALGVPPGAGEGDREA